MFHKNWRYTIFSIFDLNIRLLEMSSNTFSFGLNSFATVEDRSTSARMFCEDVSSSVNRGVNHFTTVRTGLALPLEK